MTLFSVNINKVATLRNARGENRPDIIRVAKDLQRRGSPSIPDPMSVILSMLMSRR